MWKIETTISLLKTFMSENACFLFQAIKIVYFIIWNAFCTSAVHSYNYILKINIYKIYKIYHDFLVTWEEHKGADWWTEIFYLTFVMWKLYTSVISPLWQKPYPMSLKMFDSTKISLRYEFEGPKRTVLVSWVPSLNTIIIINHIVSHHSPFQWHRSFPDFCHMLKTNLALHVYDLL